MKTYNFVRRIVNKAVNMPSDNETFILYNHLVDMQSCMAGFFAATIYHAIDRYSGELAIFSFDYWTKHLYIEEVQNAKIAEAIINSFQELYPDYLKISNDTLN